MTPPTAHDALARLTPLALIRHAATRATVAGGDARTWRETLAAVDDLRKLIVARLDAAEQAKRGRR